MHEHPWGRLCDLFDPFLIAPGFVEASLHSGEYRLGIDELDLDLLVDCVGDFPLGRGTGGFSRRGGRSRPLGLQLNERLSGSFHIRMVLSVFQQQGVEVSADLLQSLIDWRQPAAVDDHLRPPIDAQHRWYCSELLLQCVALGDRVCQLESQTRH